MSHFCIALVQANFRVGALGQNAEKVLTFAQRAASAGAQLIVFPELAIAGYPPEDLVLKRHFLEDAEAALKKLAGQLPPDVCVIVGSPRAGAPRAKNSAFALYAGRIAAIYDKMLLPNYGVFDEQRVFSPGARPLALEFAGTGIRVGIHICEDSWLALEKPCQALAGRVDAVVNLSGSPYHRGKRNVREQVLRDAARTIGAPIFYCNIVGGQDELVFDGASCVIGPEGLRARAKVFEEDILLASLPIADRRRHDTGEMEIARIEMTAQPSSEIPPRVEPPLEDLAEVYTALAVGLRDYVEKNGFKGVVVGLSGGIDSALTAALATDALGPSRVHGVTMPSRFSSAGTRHDARKVAENLGIQLFEVPIQGLFEAFLRELTPLWPDRTPDVTEENIQARIRGVIIMALSNKFGWLALTTGNKSELATGYCTLYGDMAGGFAVLKDVPKTLVFELARWRNRQSELPRAVTGGDARPAGPVIPESVITRPPTAELRENQTDQDTLPPYDLLDAIIERYVERDWGADAIVADGFDPDTVRRVIRMIDANEYKRRQGAPGVKITPKAFGRDRRLPITNGYRDRVG